MNSKFATAAFLIGCTLPSVSAQAAVVYDAITVYDRTGAVVGGVTATPAEVAANPDEVFYVSGIAIDPAEFGNYSILLVGSTPVDIVGISTGGPDGFDLAFGPGGQASDYAIQNPIEASGAPVSLTFYLDPAYQDRGYTAFFTASGNITVPSVPEPATWAMMLVGFGMVGFAMRNLRKQNVRLTYA